MPHFEVFRHKTCNQLIFVLPLHPESFTSASHTPPTNQDDEQGPAILSYHECEKPEENKRLLTRFTNTQTHTKL